LCGAALDPASLARAARATRDVAFGLASILLLTPLLAAPLAAALPLTPPALATGLAVFFCMPTTLSSGVALTAAAGGDAALALVLTLASNLIGVVTAPLAIATVLGGGGGGGGAAALDPGPLLSTLARAVAAPLALGALARATVPGLAAAVDARKRVLSRVSSILLAAVPWMQVSRAARAGAPLPAAPLAAAVAAGLALHALLLAFNMVATSLLRPGSADSGEAAWARARCAVVLCASQKTLPVAVAALGALLPPAEAGVAAVPLVGVHLGQIVVDAWAAKVRE
jgi:sodium/bile acid cotransporter 7